ncbi:tryptophan halogenase family protein [Gilvimarinus agarilyticus]|uniref:tryptophan halogenase family protein n=1 Tax=Gilvimarinus agarilyticus TaxID=679259 RepID=UPI00059F10AC|nr:tryptophan halogenase family protein [Gilvimarinus agarilyticus]
MSFDAKKPKKILIVGGGTAGWMAANLIMAHWGDVEVCLLESSDIGAVGVGEGSTPHLKLFFDAMGVSESEWMPRCNATYKNGIYFSDWSFVPGHKEYFHPFPAQVDDLTVPMFFHNVKARMQGEEAQAHPDHYFLESYLTHNNLGPLAAECFPFSVGYGYHFDSGLLGQFLAEKAIEKGLTRIDGTVTEVVLDSEGHITSVRLGDDSLLDADFFIDCSGFRSLLLQGALKVSFKSYKENLFNDAAVVLPTEISEVITPATRSTALSNGWAWKIPLVNRYGNGYVYSSNYINADQAETQLRQHLNLMEVDVDARHLTMKVGRAEKHWEKNCLAVGLSQGFIEPLEATALALTFDTVMLFMRHYEDGHFTNKFEREFNDAINVKFEAVRDYIVCHYKANQRVDTEYWRDNAANTNLSERLRAILNLWASSETFAKDMRAQNLDVGYQAKSWACLLAGYGAFPRQRPNKSQARASSHADMEQLADFIRRCGLNFRDHNELLAHMLPE